MGRTIGLIQVKGGVGRSTIATNIAGMIAESKTVALIDCDLPQATSTSWYALRKAAGKQGNLTIYTAKDHQELIKQVKELNTQYEFIVIDAPPRIAEITKAALILSDLCIIPIGASLADIWATSDLLNTIELAKVHKPNVNAQILWNKFRVTTRSAQELSKAVENELTLKELNTKLGYRVAYSDAYGEGMTVLEWTDKTAKDEMKMLGTELECILESKFLKENR